MSALKIRKEDKDSGALSTVSSTDKMLGEAGLHVIAEQGFEKRIARTQEVYDKIDEIRKLFRIDNSVSDPIELFYKLEDKLHELELLVRLTSTPYGRGGDPENKWYAVCMKGWEGLLAKAGYDTTDNMRDPVSEEADIQVSQWDALFKMKGWLEVEVFKYAKWIMDVSHKKDDVMPRYAVVLHQPFTPPGQFQPTTMRYPRQLGDEYVETRHYLVQDRKEPPPPGQDWKSQLPYKENDEEMRDKT